MSHLEEYAHSFFVTKPNAATLSATPLKAYVHLRLLVTNPNGAAHLKFGKQNSATVFATNDTLHNVNIAQTSPNMH